MIAPAPAKQMYKSKGLLTNISYAPEGQHYTDVRNIRLKGMIYNTYKPWFVEPLLGPVDGNTLISVKGGGYTDTGYIRCKIRKSWGDEDIFPGPGIFQSSFLVKCTTTAQDYDDKVGGSLSIALDGQNWIEQLYFRHFKFYQRPIVTGFTPVTDSVVGGIKITVTGSGFLDDAALWYGIQPYCKFGNQIVNATIVSKTELSCITPKYPRVELATLSITFNKQNWHTGPGAFNFVAAPKCYTCKDSGTNPTGMIAINVDGVAGAGQGSTPWIFLYITSSAIAIAHTLRG